MSNELGINAPTGLTVKAIVWGKDRATRWNGSAMVATSTIADADWGLEATGVIAMTEQDTSDAAGTGQYVGDLPATGITGEHQVDYYDGTPVVGVSPFGHQSVGGVTLASNGLDDISITTPSGMAANFREMLVQVWMRWFYKSDLNRSTNVFKTYDTSGTLVTTQTVSDDDTTQTMNKGS